MTNAVRPVLFGCAGVDLRSEEKAFFARHQPLGLILFGRNCQDRKQIVSLIKSFRAAVGRPDAPIFIDQEGGRVARLRGPLWPSLPPMRLIGALYEKDREKGLEAARLQARLIASYLYGLGITCDFAPVLDLFIEGASSVIGDRAISGKPDVVAAVGRVMVDELLANGVLPVVKHMPGHGRVLVDPHQSLPRVAMPLSGLADDFAPFQALRDAPCGMTCHVVFKAIDPYAPVSLSSKAHREIVREALGFEGIVFSDDLAMGAISRSCEEAALSALAAGSDILLYCAPEIDKMQRVAAVVPPLAPSLMDRWEAALKRVKTPVGLVDADKTVGKLFALLDYSPMKDRSTRLSDAMTKEVHD